MKKLWMRAAAAVLLALLCLALGGCGEQDPNAGSYVCAELWSGRIALETPEALLQLEQGRFGHLTLNGETGPVRWLREGETLTLEMSGELLSGTVADGVIRLRSEAGLTLVFVREELAASYLEEAAARQEARDAVLDLWTGDWYGWWEISGSPDTALLADTWYDLCARFTPCPDGTLRLRLWDEDQSSEKPMGELILRPGEDGSLVSEEGFFWFDEPGEGSWTLRQKDGRIDYTGRHEAGGESFSFTLALRRWGTRWSEGERRPYYYESWYLPLLEAGEEMPGKMGVKK